MSSVNTRLLTLTALFVTASLAQDHKEPQTVRDVCVKAAPGKAMEAEAFVRDTMVPLNQARAEAGEFAWFAFVRAIVPAGTSAKCDFRAVYGYDGLPAEAASNEQLDAAAKRAKLNMTGNEMRAKLNSLSQQVDVEYWINRDSVGASTQNGSFVRLNHYSVKPRALDEWLRLETTYWKPLVEAWDKTGGKGSWGVYQLWMPQGDNQPYDGMTVDIFPDWKSLLHEVPLDELWPKVHPHTEATEVFDQLERVRSRHDVEIYKVIDLVTSGNSTSK
jgi:hypothetical protein